MPKAIPLSRGNFAVVDDEDYGRLTASRWYSDYSHGKFYAARNISVGTKRQRKQYMHRFILGLTDPSIRVDHKDHDGLNNQKNNLRVCTPSQNQANMRKLRAAKSQFKGVSFKRQTGKWYAQIVVNRKRIHLGYFPAEQDAARAYDAAAKKYFAEFAKLNFPAGVA